MLEHQQQNIGYIYIRNHYSYEQYNACKVGKASNIPERDTQYATGEIVRGWFEAIFQVSLEHLGIIECLIQDEFFNLNIKYDAGTEFYDKKIIGLIEPYLLSIGIEYKKLTKTEIVNLVRCNRDTPTPSTKTPKLLYAPRNYQEEIINKSVEYFQTNNKGVLVMPCGVGKTLISLWIIQKLKARTVIIGVPNKLLLKQWEYVICKLFDFVPYLLVSGDIDTKTIEEFLKNHKKCIVITTYSSSYKICDATRYIKFTFDMKINDECHHLTTENMRNTENTKKYIQMLNIPAKRQLSLTATLKQLETSNDKSLFMHHIEDKPTGNDKIIISNDNIEYFGEVIDRKCLLWAIQHNVVCDYVIQSIITNNETLETHLSLFQIIEENDKRLFLSAFASLKSIYEKHSHHLLVYVNNKDNSVKIINYIKMLLDNQYFDIPTVYYSNYHSNMNSIQQREIIRDFRNAGVGIISCVYCLSEGWDFPLLDAVVFAENMTSNIRIVQSALRASRKNRDEPDKITKIILPILNPKDWLENSENTDFKRVREVVYQMSLEDETISQKIRVCKIDIEKQDDDNNEKQRQLKIKKKYVNVNYDDPINFGEYDEELTQRLILKTTRRTELVMTYQKAKRLIHNKGLMSKDAYFKLCEEDDRLPKDPELLFQKDFKSWTDYLGIETTYYDFETCREKIDEFLQANPEMKKYNLNLSVISNRLCSIDPMFPPEGLWTDYYKIHNLTEIIKIPKQQHRKIKHS